ncbi:MAG TPA: response regulator [Ktedonobacteraceae bacterium]|nr:response regulator [Ktedonobacteraceae bacterium]
MGLDDPTKQTDHAHLIQTLSAMMIQLNALQLLVSKDMIDGIDVSPTYHFPDMDAIRNGLAILEQMTRDMLYEVRAVSDDVPLAELNGVTLAEALTRAVEETAEALGLSSRINFSGEERTLSSNIEHLLYRITQEALDEVQRHTNTRKLRFALSYGRDEVQLSIEDDGVQLETSDAISGNNNQIAAPPFIPPDEDRRFASRGSLYEHLRKRIEHLGGFIEIKSSVEQGTQVRVRIPYIHHLHPETQAIPEKAKEQQALDAEDNDALTGIRVLVVDAQAVTRAGLRRLLEGSRDITVVGEARDGVQAVSETMELGPQVVIMDALLPNGQSLEALRQIKQLNPETRVLLLSSLDREDYLYETLRAGADGYVLKDIAANELAQAVHTVARGEVLVQPQIAGRLISRFGKQAQGNNTHEALTAREQEVLSLLARGLRNKEIAARLIVSERTVNFHLANIYQKLNVSGRTEALSKALEQGLITV